MFETIKTQQDNWHYVRELDIFKNDEEDVTFFHWIMNLNNLNFVTNDKSEKASFEDLVKIGEMNEEKTRIFLNKLKDNGFLLEVPMKTGNHFISNPNLAFKKFDEEWMLNFKEEFKKKERNGALKDLPVDVWKVDLSEY